MNRENDMKQTFQYGDRVRKKTGSSWQGRIVGTYKTTLTPEGYCVESEREPGSVQIYPAVALELINEDFNILLEDSEDELGDQIATMRTEG